MLFDRRRVTLKSRSQIEKMAVAGRLTAAALDAVGEAIRPGLTPLELNTIADAVIRDGGGTPNFIGVPGHLAPFEHATCISINEEVVLALLGPPPKLRESCIREVMRDRLLALVNPPPYRFRSLSPPLTDRLQYG